LGKAQRAQQSPHHVGHVAEAPFPNLQYYPDNILPFKFTHRFVAAALAAIAVVAHHSRLKPLLYLQCRVCLTI